MKFTSNSKLLVGGSVILTTVAFQVASMLVFDRYPLPIKVALLSAWLVGGTLQVWGSIEKTKLSIAPKEKAPSS